MKTFAKMLLAAIVAVGMACVAIACNASDKLVICTLFAAGIAVSGLLGVYDMPQRTKHDSIRHKTGNCGQAAVFIGTACLFVGTPQECEELADDMQHHAQQAEVRAIDGDMEFDVI
jgi:hypothetical protein